MFQMKPGQWRSSKLIGVDVYNNNNEKIGDINELILDQQGKIEAIVVGVGGFLGMGEHDVALPFNQVKFSEEPRTNATANRTDTAPTSNRQTQTNPPASNTTGSSAGTRDGNTARSGTAYRGYPDHAIVNMTKDQLKGMPQVRYAR